MAKSKSPRRERPAGSSESSAGPVAAFFRSKGCRETVESIVVALILAFLFRAFEAEAFVIPTGSMAPSLMGRHKDIECPQCGYPYQSGSSQAAEGGGGPVVGATCPLCRYTVPFDPDIEGFDSEHPSYTGDRILVSKFIYDFVRPERWDVVVFKYPDNAKLNYIKRLVGRPGETVQIRHGDIFVGREPDPDFRIARKPPHKIKAMYQLVYDTEHIAPALADVNWPTRWQNWVVDPGGARWKVNDEDQRQYARRTFEVDAAGQSSPAWLGYRHLIPTARDWPDILARRRPEDLDERPGHLITDFYGYNASIRWLGGRALGPLAPSPESLGLHWVGDLALECDVEVRQGSGTLLLELREGARHYRCTLDLANGSATLSINGGAVEFSDEKGKNRAKHPTGTVPLAGPGSYSLRLANVDDQLVLWVDGKVIAFDGPTIFDSPHDLRPQWSEQDPGDLMPVRIGAEGLKVRLSRLRIYRDIYYIASRTDGHNPAPMTDYDLGLVHFHNDQLRMILGELSRPESWEESILFDSRRSVEFQLARDQFFTLGDNSPQSKDARIWGPAHFVERKFLTGKALWIYWPHPKNKPLPFTPNFGRMGPVR